MKFSNLHQHTNFSDGKNSMEEVVLSAIERGMESIGFSDHSYTAFDESYCLLLSDYSSYDKEIKRLQEKYKDKIKIFKGIELDVFSTIDKSDYDYVIASVHALYNGETYALIDHSEEYHFKGINEVYKGDKIKYAQDYFSSLIEHVKNCKPDIVGHVDLVTKFGAYDEDNLEYREIAKNAVKELVKYCKVFEMNTGAISRKHRMLPYPERYLLEEILSLGGEVILSSDSHASDTIDFYFKECVEILKEVGFKYILKFDGEKFYKEYI